MHAGIHSVWAVPVNVIRKPTTSPGPLHYIKVKAQVHLINASCSYITSVTRVLMPPLNIIQCNTSLHRVRFNNWSLVSYECINERMGVCDPSTKKRKWQNTFRLWALVNCPPPGKGSQPKRVLPPPPNLLMESVRPSVHWQGLTAEMRFATSAFFVDGTHTPIRSLMHS